MPAQLLEFLSRVAGEWLASGDPLRQEAARWVQRHIHLDLEGGRKRRRKRKVALVDEAGKIRGGTFYVDADLLAEAEEVEG